MNAKKIIEGNIEKMQDIIDAIDLMSLPISNKKLKNQVAIARSFIGNTDSDSVSIEEEIISIKKLNSMFMDLSLLNRFNNESIKIPILYLDEQEMSDIANKYVTSQCSDLKELEILQIIQESITFFVEKNNLTSLNKGIKDE